MSVDDVVIASKTSPDNPCFLVFKPRNSLLPHWIVPNSTRQDTVETIQCDCPGEDMKAARPPPGPPGGSLCAAAARVAWGHTASLRRAQHGEEPRRLAQSRYQRASHVSEPRRNRCSQPSPCGPGPHLNCSPMTDPEPNCPAKSLPNGRLAETKRYR